MQPSTSTLGKKPATCFGQSVAVSIRNETVDTNDLVHTTNSYLTSKQLQQLSTIVTVVKPVKNGRITIKKKQLKQKQTILTLA